VQTQANTAALGEKPARDTEPRPVAQVSSTSDTLPNAVPALAASALAGTAHPTLNTKPLFKLMVERKASDLFFTSNSPIKIKIEGQILPVNKQVLTPETVRQTGGHFLFVCKPDSHPAIEEFRAAIALDERVERVRCGKQTATHRYRWLCEVPLRGDAKAITVNWLEIEIADAKGTITYRNSFVTDLPVHRDNVAELAACGRARWKIENETFNVLKTKGYNLEHNFGHGKRHLAGVLATLNLLAFAFHTICDLADSAWRAARRDRVTRQGFFQTLSTLTAYLVFPSWRELLEAMAFARPMPQGP